MRRKRPDTDRNSQCQALSAPQALHRWWREADDMNADGHLALQDQPGDRAPWLGWPVRNAGRAVRCGRPNSAQGPSSVPLLAAVAGYRPAGQRSGTGGRGTCRPDADPEDPQTGQADARCLPVQVSTPPSTTIMAPVVNELADDARYRAAPVSSSGLACLCIGMCCTAAW